MGDPEAQYGPKSNHEPDRQPERQPEPRPESEPESESESEPEPESDPEREHEHEPDFHVRGPILDQLYARLKRCGDVSCTGRPFTEHRNVPVLVINPVDTRPGWQQVTGTLTEAIRSGILAPGDELPSITELSVPSTSSTRPVHRQAVRITM